MYSVSKLHPYSRTTHLPYNRYTDSVCFLQICVFRKIKKKNTETEFIIFPAMQCASRHAYYSPLDVYNCACASNEIVYEGFLFAPIRLNIQIQCICLFFFLFCLLLTASAIEVNYCFFLFFTRYARVYISVEQLTAAGTIVSQSSPNRMDGQVAAK